MKKVLVVRTSVIGRGGELDLDTVGNVSTDIRAAFSFAGFVSGVQASCSYNCAAWTFQNHCLVGRKVGRVKEEG